MTFLNPLVLLALAAASIPLLLHLLNLRKLRTIDFSSLRFLKELQKTRIRKLKLRQLLLLLLRIGLVVFAVLAFARPALRSTSGLAGQHAAATVVVLLDNSFSMSARDAYGERFKQAKDAALKIVESLEGSDETYIVPIANADMANTQPSRNREVLRRTIEDMKMSYRRADYDDAMRVASTLLDRSQNLNREVYLITDAQSVNVVQKQDSMHIFDQNVRLYVMPVGSGKNLTQNNLGIDSVRIVSAFFETGKPVELRAWIRNYGTEDVENIPVAAYLHGERLATAGVNIPAGKTVSVDLAPTPKRIGPVGGYIEIGGDALEADNKRYFALTIPDNVNVAVVGTPETTRFLDLVFGIARSITVRHASPGSVASLDVSKLSAVILADAPIPQSEAVRLGEYVQQGGGVVLYAGPNTERNTAIASALGVSVGGGTGGGDSSSSVTFGMVDKAHPLFSGVFDAIQRGGSVESPKIRRMVPSLGGQTVIGTSNGQAFMSEFRRGRGRVVCIAVPPNTNWSDLPLKEIFVPIAVRSALYVASGGDVYPQITVGSSVVLSLPSVSRLPDQLKLTLPDNRDEFIPVRQLPGGASIRYDNANVPGIYRINTSEKTIAMFAANVMTGESDLKAMDEESLLNVMRRRTTDPKNVKLLKATSGDFAASIGSSRFGLELWKYMLGLALVCAFAEMVVGRQGKQG